MKYLTIFIISVVTTLDLLAGTAVQRSSTGLLLREDFSNPSGWTSVSGFTAEINPALVSFGQLPIVTLQRTPGGIDSQGCRESHVLIDGDWRDIASPRHLFYGSSSASTPGWRPMLANSSDGGKTWTKLGSWGPGLANGTGGNYSARDFLYAEKRGGNYVIHAMIGQGNFGDSDGAYPTPPYTSDVWTTPSLSTWTTAGAFTYIGNSCVVGGSGSFDEKSAYAGSIIRDQFGGYVLYYSTTNGDETALNVGLSDNTPLGSPTGPFTKRVSSGILPINTNYGENPKVFWSNALQKYVMLQDKAYVPGFNAFLYMWTNDQLRDWSTAAPTQIMRVCPADGPKRIGLATPYFLAESQPVETDDGYIPISYDNDARDSIDAVGNNLWCRIVSAVLEPSRYALDYVPASSGSTTIFFDNFNRSNRSLDGDNGWVQSAGTPGSIAIVSNQADLGTATGDSSIVNSGSSITNGTVTSKLTIGLGASVGIIWRYTDSGNYYFTDYYFPSAFAGQIQITEWKKSGGSFTQLETGRVTCGLVGTQFTLDHIISGQNITTKINGTTQGLVVHGDGTFTGAGICGLRNGGPEIETRLADDFTVSTNATIDTIVRTYRKTLSNTDFIAEYTVTFNEDIGSSFHGFDYRIQGGGDSYRVSLSTGSGLVLQKSSSGTYSNLATSSGALVAIQGMAHRIKISAAGNVHTLWLDGEQQISYTDGSSPFTSGVAIGFAAKTIQQTVRLLSMRAADTVTVNGLTAGQVVTLRAPGTPPIATTTASGGTVTFTNAHFPAGSIDIDGVDNQILGNIWGGDVFTVPASSPARAYSY